MEREVAHVGRLIADVEMGKLQIPRYASSCWGEYDPLYGGGNNVQEFFPSCATKETTDEGESTDEVLRREYETRR